MAYAKKCMLAPTDKLLRSLWIFSWFCNWAISNAGTSGNDPDFSHVPFNFHWLMKVHFCKSSSHFMVWSSYNWPLSLLHIGILCSNTSRQERVDKERQLAKRPATKRYKIWISELSTCDGRVWPMFYCARQIIKHLGLSSLLRLCRQNNV